MKEKILQAILLLVFSYLSALSHPAEIKMSRTDLLLGADFENEETLTLCKKLFENNFKVLNGFNLSIPFIRIMLKKKLFYGISIKGNNEIRPGYKDYSSFSDILEFLSQ